MENFKQYRRTQIAQMRPVNETDIINAGKDTRYSTVDYPVSISEADRQNGSPKIGDMIARNPENHRDQWLVAEKYFKDNFEEM